MVQKMSLKEWTHKREVMMKVFTDPESDEDERDHAYLVLEHLFKLREHGYVEEE